MSSKPRSFISLHIVLDAFDVAGRWWRARRKPGRMRSQSRCSRVNQFVQICPQRASCSAVASCTKLLAANIISIVPKAQPTRSCQTSSLRRWPRSRWLLMLQHRHREWTVGPLKFVGSCHAGKAAADDGDIYRNVTLEWRFRCVVAKRVEPEGEGGVRDGIDA